jgi:hypothetical protein
MGREPALVFALGCVALLRGVENGCFGHNEKYENLACRGWRCFRWRLCRAMLSADRFFFRVETKGSTGRDRDIPLAWNRGLRAG